MTTPQQPGVRRSTHNAADPDAPATTRTADRIPAESEAPAPVPEDNRPGHHPDREQDQPAVVQDRHAGGSGTGE